MQKNEACTCNNIITVSVDSVNGVGREKRSAEGLGRPFLDDENLLESILFFY